MQGYSNAMIDDGLTKAFHNTMTQNGLEHIFAAKSISEENGVAKPSWDMFQKALERLGLTDEDKGRIIMVGNNLKRDVVGAKRFGIHSVLLSWSPRYDMVPSCEEEIPDYVITMPEQLLELVNKLDRQLS